MGAAKEYIGQVINEMFIVKKEAATKRFLPSIKNMKIVSCRETDESIVCTHVTLTFRIIIHSRFCNCNEIHLIATWLGATCPFSWFFNHSKNAKMSLKKADEKNAIVKLGGSGYGVWLSAKYKISSLIITSSTLWMIFYFEHTFKRFFTQHLRYDLMSIFMCNCNNVNNPVGVARRLLSPHWFR